MSSTYPPSSYFPPSSKPQPGAKKPARQLGHTTSAASEEARHARAMNRQAEPAYIARHYLQPPWQPPLARKS
jgi:hypothetical protein